MAERGDLYGVLGVARDCSEEDLKRAYRRLALECHPDVNPGDNAKEARFKEINVAYETLKDPARRALYDEFGAAALQQGFDADQARAWRAPPGGGTPWAEGAGYDVADLLGQAFGGGVRRTPRSGPAPRDVALAVELDLGQALRGTHLDVEVPQWRACGACGGSGEQPGAQAASCRGCRGTGRATIGDGPFRVSAACDECGGSGARRPACGMCRGRGAVERRERVRVRIPPGADDGSRLRVPGHGSAGGDLVIETRVRPHPHFRRDGLDLHLKLPVTLDEAWNGASIDVPTVDGAVKLRVPPRSSGGTVLRLRGKGVHRGDESGDLYAELRVVLPDAPDRAFDDAVRASARAYRTPVRAGLGL
ncbi:MAG: J domain-containing protein [Deltaproteobacteria bacterium]|nr:J domain-containing protein [Deltaproteobacteria bacterium]